MRQYYKKSSVLLAVPFTLFSHPLLAQTAPDSAASAKTLPTVVVTATRQQQRANELLSDVSVIEREEIERAGPSTTLPELLGRQPGIQFTSTGAPGGVSNILIRGTNASHALILIDGVRVNSATLGETSLSRIPLSQVDHIEILRGPASALYGSEAIGGVVQIFTRQGAGAAQPSVEVGYGTNDSSNVGAGVAGSARGLSYSIYGNSFHTRGFSSIRNPSNASYNRDRDGFRNNSVTGSLAYRFNADHKAGVNLFVSNGRNQYDGSWPSPASFNYLQETEVTSAAAYVSNRFLPKWNSTLRAARSSDDSTSYTGASSRDIFRTDQTQYGWQNDIDLPLGRMLFALEQIQQTVSGNSTFTRTQRDLKAVLAGWTAHAGDHRWQLNVRRDSNNQFGGKNTGLAAYGYQFSPAWRANVSVGTALKIPTFNDLYYPNTPFVGVGNPDLKPEFARNRETAVHYDDGTHSASLTYYNNRISDLIQWQETPPGSWFYMPLNVATAKLEGWTLAYEGKLGHYDVRGNLDWIDPRDMDTGKLLVRRARNTANLSVTRTFANVTLGMEAQAVGSRYNDTTNTKRLGAYTLVNLSGSYALCRNWTAFARFNNMFNKKYEKTADYATPGANLFVGVRYSPKTAAGK